MKKYLKYTWPLALLLIAALILLIPKALSSTADQIEAVRERMAKDGEELDRLKRKQSGEELFYWCQHDRRNLPEGFICPVSLIPTAYADDSIHLSEPQPPIQKAPVTSQNAIIEANKPSVGNIKFTSYNPERGQTDGSPCIGASGADLCRFIRDEEYRFKLIGTREYIEPIALSQELVGRSSKKLFHYYDIVTMVSDNGDARCNKKAVVLDTMNARFRKRGDLFFPERKFNTGCTATVTKL